MPILRFPLGVVRLRAPRVPGSGAVLVVPFIIALVACGDITGPDGGGAALAASPAEVEAFLPAIDDVVTRILPTGEPPLFKVGLAADLRELDSALRRRSVRDATRAMTDARARLRACDDACLAAPERSVIALTLDHAAVLVGLGDDG